MNLANGPPEGWAGTRSSECSSVEGTPFDDRLKGAATPDSLSAGYGNDRLVGESGEDSLLGGPGGQARLARSVATSSSEAVDKTASSPDRVRTDSTEVTGAMCFAVAQALTA